MQELKLPETLKRNVHEFVENLKELYRDDLISIALYGSAASGEFIETHSNVNLLIILKNTNLPTLELSRKLVNKRSNRRIEPLFLSHEYLLNSGDVFPIEFLDMKENHTCLYGQDVLKEIKIDPKNLRFQCEQELKSKLILLKQQYLKINPKDRTALANLLFRNLTSALHILRNLVRLKGKRPSYKKEDVLKEVSLEFGVGSGAFFKILHAKKNSAALKAGDFKTLLAELTLELDKITEIVDKL
ncbi:MAG: hypothetical protein COS99_03755 [Candidatus Omnitrophica bacterium CG07_land_8_20_14_0_80_42_15]|uniref:Polymerase nucleotidyl transferase domain-containing protein n=1 Tax=Candidatus Aquitaenariimonas noxiae TaxID=1974741 RepID=A0A2J0KTL6_9BACT|nr:MAG: hypothetical protein COS99_03755 [Candidatus Omnitrophica bacterium CG07_land_8_20_14_0_80_42_15]